MEVSAFVDTNILLYLTPAGYDEPAKRERAFAVLEAGCTLSVQVLDAFVAQSTRTSRIDALPIERALSLVDTFRAFPIVPLDLAVFDAASAVKRRTNYQWWDCTIIGSSITAGCDRLLSEDMQHGQVVDDVRIVNPFRELV